MCPAHRRDGESCDQQCNCLAEAGADAKDDDGETPLHAAIRNDNPDVITRLIKLGADGTAKTDDGETAWDLAQNNEALRDTKAWWLLNDLRF